MLYFVCYNFKESVIYNGLFVFRLLRFFFLFFVYICVIYDGIFDESGEDISKGDDYK